MAKGHCPSSEAQQTAIDFANISLGGAKGRWTVCKKIPSDSARPVIEPV